MLNASQTFYSDNASQRAPPLRFESSRPRRKAVMTGNRGRIRIGGGRGSGCSGVAVLCSFLGRSKLRSGTCRFHATKRLGPDFDLAETLSPRPHDRRRSTNFRLLEEQVSKRNNNSLWETKDENRLIRIFIIFFFFLGKTF